MDTLARLQAIPDLAQVPSEQVQWLIDHGELRRYQPGELLFSAGEFSQYLHIILAGRIRVWFEQNGQTREVGRLEYGDITGVLPYSRLTVAKGYGTVLEETQVLSVHRDVFPEMIRTQYELVEALVHVMTNRVRDFTTMQVQNEKLMSLGKLSAGLAHELNNPASAVLRVAKDLKAHLAYLPDGFKRVIAIRMDDAEIDAVNSVVFERVSQPLTELSALARNRREQELEDWLDDHDTELDGEQLDALVDFGFTEEQLDFVLEHTGERELAPVLNWVGNVLTTEKYVREIQDASQRISDLVTSIKSYTYMDQAQDRQLIDLREGIYNTRRMLEHKFRKHQIGFDTDFPADLPAVHVNAGELNQVWTNLMDNSLDALAEQGGGNILVSACVDGPCLRINLIDDGPGIPEEVQHQIFDPFFTTKPMGKGTGLGLDVVRRILQAHRTEIKLDSRPGRTEFSLWFPLEQANEPSAGH